MARYLTKSRFKLAVECPRKLFYAGKREYRDILEEDAFLQALADGGFQVGELAKALYPDGIEVEARVNAEALADTAELLRRDNVTLFEPAIAYGQFLVRVDVLIKTGNSLKLVEVKSKSFRSDDPQIEGKNGLKSGFKPYIEDIAFQNFVVSNAFPDSRVSCYLLMPDKCLTAVIDRMNQLFKIDRRDGRINIVKDPSANELTFDQSLLSELNVDSYISLVHQHGVSFPGGNGPMGELAKQWAKAYALDQPLPPTIGSHCAKCQFKAKPDDTLKSGFHECWKDANNWQDADFADPTLLDLWNFRGKQKLMDLGVRKLAEITQDDVKLSPGDHGMSNSERQWIQVQWATGDVPLEYKSAGFFLDHSYMAQEGDSWRYPLHFIDFETAAVALPFHLGMRPYESVAFQFSHHVMEQDGSLRHADQFLLAEPGEFPNYEFARALRDALSRDDGSVFMWASHENTILTHIIEQLKIREDAPDDKEELIAFLLTLTKGGHRAMVDLRTIAQKGYFHPSTKGSNSIKKVLPALLQSSAYLRERYSKPIYGAQNGIPSQNFRDMTWWSLDELGLVEDPYKKLKSEDVTGQLIEDIADDDLDILGGGEATMAYGRLQFEKLNPDTRDALIAKLLRYCELDTLAMAMVVEAWKAELQAT